MRFTKSVMAIAAICVAMLTMTGIRRSRKRRAGQSGSKRRGLGRARHS